MNRKIKFRAKRLNSNEWVYGNLVETHHFKYILCVSFIPAKTLPVEEFIEIDPKTICEFTNHFDIDGKEIYEGDFYREENGGDYVDERIYFICVYIKELSRFAWLSVDEKFEYETTSNDELESFIDTEMGMIEKYSKMKKIVGNIIDNANKLENA